LGIFPSIHAIDTAAKPGWKGRLSGADEGLVADIRAIWYFLRGRWRGTQERFRAIYLGNFWGDAESRSGPGSRRDSPCVVETLEALDRMVREHGCTSMADLPCGDCNWIGPFLSAHPHLAYVGYDIVPELVADNAARLPWRFAVLDVVRNAPARADLILCKDLFNHLTNAEVTAALDNMLRSGARWLLASNNFGHFNRALPRINISTSRHLDLTGAPFFLPQPVWRTDYLGLWDLDVLRAARSG
jgi:hypothetical protein